MLFVKMWTVIFSLVYGHRLVVCYVYVFPPLLLIGCSSLDVIGRMTRISDEEECVRDGKDTKMVLLQLIDRKFYFRFFVKVVDFLFLSLLLDMSFEFLYVIICKWEI